MAEPFTGAPTFYVNAVPVYVNSGDYAEFTDTIADLLCRRVFGDDIADLLYNRMFGDYIAALSRRLARKAALGEALTAPSLALPAQGRGGPGDRAATGARGRQAT